MEDKEKSIYEEIQKWINSQQKQCINDTLKEWNKEYPLEEFSPPEEDKPIPRPNETVRPAFIVAYGVKNNDVSLPDIIGHGELVKTKDEKLVFLGRVSPNWTRVIIAQGGFTKTKILGKKFRDKLIQAANKQLQMLRAYATGVTNPANIATWSGQVPIFNINIAEFGVIVLGRAKEWVNPYHMQQCNANTWYGEIASLFMNLINDFLIESKEVMIPLYTRILLERLSGINPKKWRYNSGEEDYSRPPMGILEPIIYPTGQGLPHFYYTIALRVPAFRYSPIGAPAGFIANYLKTRYALQYSTSEILKTGIGAPLQSSNWCGKSCSQYGNFAQVIGTGTVSYDVLNNYDSFIALPHPDYGGKRNCKLLE